MEGSGRRYLRERGAVEGYLIYGISDPPEGRTPERALKAHELVVGNLEARAGLLSFMAAQDPLASRSSALPLAANLSIPTWETLT